VLTINNYRPDTQGSKHSRLSISSPQAVSVTSQAVEWTCPICSYCCLCASIVDGKIKCSECGVSSSCSEKDGPSQQPGASWICTICDTTNSEHASLKCGTCGVLKKASSEQPVPCRSVLPLAPPLCTRSLQPSSLTAEDFLPVPTSVLRLSFRSGGASKFAAQLKAVLERRAWVPRSTLKPDLAPPSQSLGVGLAGIMKKMDLHQLQAQSEMTDAFEDLNSLISKASEMVVYCYRMSPEASLILLC